MQFDILYTCNVYKNLFFKNNLILGVAHDWTTLLLLTISNKETRILASIVPSSLVVQVQRNSGGRRSSKALEGRAETSISFS